MAYNTFSCRNDIVEKAQKEDYEYILFVDGDNILYDSLTLVNLYNTMKNIQDACIVSALYKQDAKLISPILDNHFWTPVPIKMKSFEKIMYDCNFIGFGCILIKTSVFDKLKEPYFRWDDPTNKKEGDDLCFVKKVRKAGITVWCDPSIYVGHLKQVMI